MNLSRVLKVLMVIAAFAASLGCEWVLARLAGGSAFIPPVTTLAVMAILWFIPFGPGLALALAAGFLLDSMAPPPFGSTMLLFVVLACVREAARQILVKRVRFAVHGALAAGFMLLAGALAFLARVAAGLMVF